MNYKKRDDYKKLISVIQGLIILGLETAAFGVVWYEVYDITKELDESFAGAGNLVVIIYAVILMFFTRLNGGYKFGHLRLMDLIFSQILSLIGANVISYFIMCLALRQLLLPGAVLLLTLIGIMFIFIYNGLMYFLEMKLFPPRQLILVYGDKGPLEMFSTFRTRTDKFHIAETVHESRGLTAIMEKVEKSDGVILHRVHTDIRSEILHLCYRNDIRAYVVPYISDIILWSSGDTHLFDTPMLVTHSHSITAVEAFFKRMMDIAVSLLMLIIFSPVMLLVAIGVKLQDGGPIIYKQDRVTKDGRIFKIFKFRSMTMDSEANGARLATKDDDRVTKLGRVIRDLHVDELPQLINVLKGDMSLVGPRPERPEIIERYKDEIPEFDYRLKVKAGLTGYAQVYGRYKTPSYNKLKLDMIYIEHYSIWLDIKLLFLTFKIIFIKDNSEGFDEKTADEMQERMQGAMQENLEENVQGTGENN